MVSDSLLHDRGKLDHPRPHRTVRLIYCQQAERRHLLGIAFAVDAKTQNMIRHAGGLKGST
jgi:hypothetical protein